jgi:hypothetical protein
MSTIATANISKGQRFVCQFGTVYEVVRVMRKSGQVTLARLGKEDHEAVGSVFPAVNAIGVSRHNSPIKDVLEMKPYVKPAKNPAPATNIVPRKKVWYNVFDGVTLKFLYATTGDALNPQIEDSRIGGNGNIIYQQADENLHVVRDPRTGACFEVKHEVTEIRPIVDNDGDGFKRPGYDVKIKAVWYNVADSCIDQDQAFEELQQFLSNHTLYGYVNPSSPERFVTIELYPGQCEAHSFIEVAGWKKVKGKTEALINGVWYPVKGGAVPEIK